jgi:cell division protease FtsH
MLIVLAIMVMGMWLWKSTSERGQQSSVAYSDFFTWVEQGKVESVQIAGDLLQGRLKEPQTLRPTEDVAPEKPLTGRGPQGQSPQANQPIQEFRTNIPPDEALLPKLRDKGVRIEVKSRQQPFAVELLLTVLPWALIIGVWLWISRRAQRMMGGGGGPFSFMKSQGRKFEKSESTGVTFDQVAGLKAAKQDLQEIVQFLKEPERFRRLGGKIPRGVLLIGPPGTGKTLLARAVAGESGVPFFSISASEFVELFVGMGASRVRDLFSQAKKSAPAIVFIDEIDAVGRSRGVGLGAGHDEREQTLNQLLAEMDGFERNDLVVVMAATNRPDVLDSALLRPGRFDRRVMVDRPELAARRAILAVHTRGKPLASDVDLERIAETTPGFSGADLENLVNEAALHATRMGAGAISTADFNAAYDKVVLGDPRESMLDPKEKKRVAVHEAGHALVGHFSEHSEPLHRVSIIPRGMALGVTQQSPGKDRHIMTQPQLETRLRVLMGGYAAERLLLGDVSTGAENDLKQATELASKMVAHYGMSEKLGPVYYDHNAEHPLLGHTIGEGGTSEATISTIEAEARQLLARALTQAADVLAEHRAAIDALVDRLLHQETIERDELGLLLGARAVAA